MEQVVITGANRGIGLALAAAFAQGGAVVHACCRRPSEATELNALATSTGQVHVHGLDVTSDESIRQAAQVISGHTDHVDLLINNAGINNQPGTRGLEQLTRLALNTIIDNNATSALIVTQAFYPLLRASAHPRVAMISSQIGSMAWADPARGYKGYGYAMSKAAMNMAARILASELGSAGLTTVTIHPGWVRTDMGGTEADISPEESAAGIHRLLTTLTPAANGSFFKWNGEIHPW
ncbi:MAG: SDR family oxidoreductase [Anaerolineae bacterium]